MRIFFDFEDCLTNNAHTVGYFLKDAIALCGVERVEEVRSELSASGFTLEAFVSRLNLPLEKVREYRESMVERSELFAGVLEGLRALKDAGNDLVLITSGIAQYQRPKMEAIDGFLPLFSNVHIIWNGPTKGDVIVGYGAQPGDVFIDNTPKQLTDVRAKAPWVRVVRMLYPGVQNEQHEGDNVQWDVVCSMDEFTALLHEDRA